MNNQNRSSHLRILVIFIAVILLSVLSGMIFDGISKAVIYHSLRQALLVIVLYSIAIYYARKKSG